MQLRAGRSRVFEDICRRLLVLLIDICESIIHVYTSEAAVISSNIYDLIRKHFMLNNMAD